MYNSASSACALTLMPSNANASQLLERILDFLLIGGPPSKRKVPCMRMERGFFEKFHKRAVNMPCVDVVKLLQAWRKSNDCESTLSRSEVKHLSAVTCADPEKYSGLENITLF